MTGECNQKRLVLECVDHAALRAVAACSRDLSRGLVWLASISATSFMVGLVATAGQMITRIFYSCGGSWASCNFPVGARLSFALSFGEFGLFVSLVSFFGYRYLLSQVEKLKLDMHAGRLQLLNNLARRLSGTA